MKTVFITGADGFIGQNLIPILKSKAYDVVGGVRNRARKLAFEKQFGKAIVCEVGDAINVARAVASARPDCVIHLASPTSQESTDDPLSAFQSSVAACANLLDAVRRTAPRAKVLLCSSWEAYGTGNPGPLSESSAAQPSSILGALCLSAETMARTFFETYHLNVTLARLFPALGGGISTESYFGTLCQSLISWDAGRSGGSFNLPAGPSKLDLLHVLDLSDGLIRLMEDGKPNETYNVCSGQSQSTRDIASRIAKACGKQPTISDSSSSAPAWPVGDNSRLSKLGWQASRSIDNAVADLVLSYSKMTVGSAA